MIFSTSDSFAGTKNVIDCCKAEGVRRLVYTSSASVVFDGTHQANLDESFSPPSTLDAYTQSKLRGETVLLNANGNDLCTVSIRPHGIFGPRDPHFVPALAKAGAAGKSKWVLGDGGNLVDFTHVTNVAYSHLLAACQLQPGAALCGKAYFITNDEPILFWDMVSAVQRGLGNPLPSLHLPSSLMLPMGILSEKLGALFKFSPTFTRQSVTYATVDHYYSCERARVDFGYVPPVPLRTAITTTIDAFKHLRRKQPISPPSSAQLQTRKPSIITTLKSGVVVVIALAFIALMITLLYSPQNLGFSGCCRTTPTLLGLLIGVGLFMWYRSTPFGEPIRRFSALASLDLRQQQILVTGANKGIGYSTALRLAKQGATIHMACRDAKRGAEAVEKLRKAVPDARVHLHSLDLSSLASVRQFLDRCRSQNLVFTTVINNAGAMEDRPRVTDDNMDLNYQANFVSHWLLTVGLWRNGTMDPSCRVVNVSSLMHTTGYCNVDEITQIRKHYDAMQVYSNSKLMQMLFTFKLYRLFRDESWGAVNKQEALQPRRSVIAVHPVCVSIDSLEQKISFSLLQGAVSTDFIGHFIPHSLVPFVIKFLDLFVTVSPSTAAETVCYAACAPQLRGSSGVYISNCRTANPAPQAKDEEAQEALWNHCARLCKELP